MKRAVTRIKSFITKGVEITVEFPEDHYEPVTLTVPLKTTVDKVIKKLEDKHRVTTGKSLFFDGVELEGALSSNTKLVISNTKIIVLRTILKEDEVHAMSMRQYKRMEELNASNELFASLSLPDSKENLVEYVRKSVIGNDRVIQTAFGERRITYCDYVASGRALTFIEDWIRNEVLPMYANTHTDLSSTGNQVNYLREESRAIIGKCCNCTEEDEVIFCGNGSTGAINAITRILGITVPDRLNQLVDLRSLIPEAKIPVVFIGPYEHHSNELPWRESLVDLITIGMDSSGRINLVELEEQLSKYQHRETLIASFSAGSNVTGVLSLVQETTRLVKQYGALSFWDYAAAAPYVTVDMNPSEDAKIDAIFMSPHKFVGGPGCSGVLLVKKHVFIGSRVPNNPGGGTVTWVSKREHHYNAFALHEREEGGTPNIIGDIKCGLVFNLKSVIGTQLIESLESSHLSYALHHLKQNSNIVILGNTPGLSTISFFIRHGHFYLHHHLVCALLNDIFGIQSRSGCACAGPYGQHNLRIDDDQASEFGSLVNRYQYWGVKPGFCRLNLNYFISKEEVEYVVDAVKWVAEHGWKMVIEYRFDIISGKWRHRRNEVDVNVRLRDVIYEKGYAHRKLSINLCKQSSSADESHYAKYRAEANQLANEMEKYFEMTQLPDDFVPDVLPREFDQMRWFQTPVEILQEMQKGKKYQQDVIQKIPPSETWHCNMIYTINSE